MPHRELHTLSYTEAPFRCSHTFFKHTNKRFCFAMNNAAVVALFGHIALDGTPRRQRPASRNVAESVEAFWWLKGRKGGHSINVQRSKNVSLEPLALILTMTSLLCTLCRYATHVSRSWTNQ